MLKWPERLVAPQNFPKLDFGTSYLKLFEGRCHQLSELVRGLGVETKPVSDAALVRFAQLDEKSAARKVGDLLSYMQVIGGFEKMRDKNRSLTWKEALALMIEGQGWSYSKGAIDLLTEDGVHEIYSPDGTQLFRNLRFLELCSYSIADLYAYEWPELFRRPAAITSTLIEVTTNLVQGQVDGPVNGGSFVPSHVLEEVFSDEKRCFWVEQSWLVPLKDSQGMTAAFVNTLRATRIHPESTGDVRPLSR